MGRLDVSWRSLSAHGKRQPRVNLVKSLRACQIIERGQANSLVWMIKQRQIFGVAIGIAGKIVENQPAKQLRGVQRRFGRHLAEQPVTLGETHPAVCLAFPLAALP